MTDQPTLPVVEATHLHRTFLRGSTAVHAIRDVSLTLDAGEFVSIQGPSGSGKSSLLHLLAGLDAPDTGTGTVHVDGTALGGLDEAARTTFRRRRIGLVLQTFDLLPTLDAVDNVARPRRRSPRTTALGVGDRRVDPIRERAPRKFAATPWLHDLLD